MKKARRKRAKYKTWLQHPSFRAFMKHVEPKKFREDNYFSPDSGDADSWRFCWAFEKPLIVLLILLASFQIWWMLPVVFFPFTVSWFFRSGIEGKAGTGFPYMEAGDIMGVLFASMLSFFGCLVWTLQAL